jgi:DNA-binding Lrp family transcriptional regulator
MMRAYILVTTAVGRATEVATRLRRVEVNGGRVIAAEAVTGLFGVVAVAEVRDWDALGFVITYGIEPVDGVERADACISLKCPTPNRSSDALAA